MRKRRRSRNYGVAVKLPPRKRLAKAAEMGEEELLSGLLNHLQVVNGQIGAIEDFRMDVAAIRMDKELPLHPLTEDILAVYKDMNARYKELRDYILSTLGVFESGGSAEPELDLED
jgi:hypothetical protein